MKEKLSKSLLSSLDKERKAVKEKITTKTDDRFLKAEKALDIENFYSNTPEETVKVKRDTFTLPEEDYKLLYICKSRLLKKQLDYNKSEIMRAGLIFINSLNDSELIKALSYVKKIKTGRKSI